SRNAAGTHSRLPRGHREDVPDARLPQGAPRGSCVVGQACHRVGDVMAKKRGRLTPEWIGYIDGGTPGLVFEPNHTAEKLWENLDWLEDDCIHDLGGFPPSIVLLVANPLSRQHYAAHMLLAITRIRRSFKSQDFDGALCGALDLGKILAEETMYADQRW